MNKYDIQVTSKKLDWEDFRISDSKSVEEFARKFFHSDIVLYESFFLILMNRGHIVHGYAKISQGGVTGTTVDVRIVAKYVVETLSSAVVLVHNHPSGNVKPSKADFQVTQQICSALQFFNVKVLDHLVLTEDTYYSFSDHNKMT